MRSLWDSEWDKWFKEPHHVYEIGDDVNQPRNVRGHWLRREIVKYPIETVLDVGCGVGWYDKMLVEMGYDVTGCDISPHGIKYAKKYVPDARFFVSSVEDLDVENEYDMVMCFCTLVCVPDMERAVENIYKATRRYVFFVEQHYQQDKTHVNKITPESLRTLYGKGVLLSFTTEGKYSYGIAKKL